MSSKKITYQIKNSKKDIEATTILKAIQFPDNIKSVFEYCPGNTFIWVNVLLKGIPHSATISREVPDFLKQYFHFMDTLYLKQLKKNKSINKFSFVSWYPVYVKL